MKKILLEIKHSINKRIGNAIESISCRLYYHSKKNSWGHCLYAMNNIVFRLYRLKLLVIMSMRNRI